MVAEYDWCRTAVLTPPRLWAETGTWSLCNPGPSREVGERETQQSIDSRDKEWNTAGTFLTVAASPSLLYLQRHLDEHKEFLDADPDSLAFELLRDAGALFIREAPQKLQRKRRKAEILTAAFKMNVANVRFQGCVCAHECVLLRAGEGNSPHSSACP